MTLFDHKQLVLLDQYSLIERSIVLYVTAILECFTNNIFKLGPMTHMIQRKRDSSNPDIQPRLDLYSHLY